MEQCAKNPVLELLILDFARPHCTVKSRRSKGSVNQHLCVDTTHGPTNKAGHNNLQIEGSHERIGRVKKPILFPRIFWIKSNVFESRSCEAKNGGVSNNVIGVLHLEQLEPCGIGTEPSFERTKPTRVVTVESHGLCYDRIPAMDSLYFIHDVKKILFLRCDCDKLGILGAAFQSRK